MPGLMQENGITIIANFFLTFYFYVYVQLFAFLTIQIKSGVIRIFLIIF